MTPTPSMRGQPLTRQVGCPSRSFPEYLDPPRSRSDATAPLDLAKSPRTRDRGSRFGRIEPRGAAVSLDRYIGEFDNCTDARRPRLCVTAWQHGCRQMRRSSRLRAAGTSRQRLPLRNILFCLPVLPAGIEAGSGHSFGDAASPRDGSASPALRKVSSR